MLTWKKIKRSVPFTAGILVITGITSALVAGLILSDDGKRVAKEYFLSMTEYYGYFAGAALFLIALLPFAGGYLTGKNRARGFIERQALDEISDLKATHEKNIQKLETDVAALNERHEMDLRENSSLEKKLLASNLTINSLEDANRLITHEADTHLKEIGRQKEFFAKNQWLIEIEKKQAENIDEYVFEKGVSFISYDFIHGIPSFNFILRVYNASIFDLIIDSKIRGDIYFRGTVFHCEKHFLEAPKTIKAGQTQDLFFEIQLSDPQLDLVKKAPKSLRAGNNISPIEFGFSGMIIIVKGDGFDQVVDKRVKFPRRLSVDVGKYLEEFL
jgi:hypothetical protein